MKKIVALVAVLLCLGIPAFARGGHGGGRSSGGGGGHRSGGGSGGGHFGASHAFRWHGASRSQTASAGSLSHGKGSHGSRAGSGKAGATRSKVPPATGQSGKGSRRQGSSTRIVHVHEYTTKSGKHVRAHDRTAPNGTRNDNWSTQGNVNPETGVPGTKEPDPSTPPPPPGG